LKLTGVYCDHYWPQTDGQSSTPRIQEKLGVGSISLQIPFTVDSAELAPEVKQTLDNLGNALNDTALSSCCFQIEGHTDDGGNAQYNLQLSKKRADSVRRYLEDNYHLAGRINAVGYGQTKPIADNRTEEGRQQNRRIQIVNLGYGQVE